MGRDKAEASIGLLDQLPVKIVSVEHDLVKEAAEIKSDYVVSYADAFCIATARRHNGRVLTSDPEFKLVEQVVKVTRIA